MRNFGREMFVATAWSPVNKLAAGRVAMGPMLDPFISPVVSPNVFLTQEVGDCYIGPDGTMVCPSASVTAAPDMTLPLLIGGGALLLLLL